MTRAQFEVVDGEIIGDKADMLRRFQPDIEAVGLRIPPTIVIPSETVQAADNAARRLPNEATKAILEAVCQRYESSPALVIRSSGAADGGGNGAYDSRFSANVPELVIKEAGLVIGSFATDEAADFRRQTGSGDEFAMMIQPVVGQDLGSDQFWEQLGPYLSGYGYSSSKQHSNGYINVVAGLGGGVSRPGGQLVTPEDLDEIIGKTVYTKYEGLIGSELSFYGFLRAISEAITMGHMDDTRTDFRYGKEGELFAHELVNGKGASAQYLIRQAGTTAYEYKSSGLLSTGIDQAAQGFVPYKFFEALHGIEQRVGCPVYVEWALDATGGPVILQIAPAEQTLRGKLEAQIEGKNIIAEARHLLGHGVKHANKIVLLGEAEDIEHLHEFNKNPDNEGYILLVDSFFSGPYSPTQLRYADCSKAGALIEIKSDNHHHQHQTGSIVQHLFSAYEKTEKCIGEVTEHTGSIDEISQRIHERGRRWHSSSKEILDFSQDGSVHVLDGEFSILADETNGRFMVTESPKQ